MLAFLVDGSFTGWLGRWIAGSVALGCFAGVGLVCWHGGLVDGKLRVTGVVLRRHIADTLFRCLYTGNQVKPCNSYINSSSIVFSLLTAPCSHR